MVVLLDGLPLEGLSRVNTSCFTVVSVRWEFRRFDPRKSEIADSKNDVSLEMESAYKYLERLVC